MKNWEVKRLWEVCKVFADGDWIESKDQSLDGIRLIQTGNVGNGLFKDRGEKARYISEITFDRLRCTEIFEGDCLISRLPDPVGRSCILPNTGQKMITAVDCTIVRFDSKKVAPHFFNYYSQSNQYLNDVERETTGTTRKRISRKSLGEISTPVPPLPEQQRIVVILDEAFAAIATAKKNAEKNLKNARELFESYLQSVFANPGDGWEEKNLGEVCLIKPPKSEVRKQLVSSDLVSFVPMENLGIGSKYLVASQVRPLEDVAGSYTYFAEEDVLLAKITPCFENGKLGIARNLSNGVGFGSSEYIVFRTTESLHNEFLYYFLSREQFREEGAQRMSGAVGHKRVAKEFIENYPIRLPPLPEQRAIVAKLDALSVETKKLEAIYWQKLADLEELKKSVLQKAFAGEL
ncbi:MAG: restriction endonuclease subunit S [Deltaproteobacteria bacterium]